MEHLSSSSSSAAAHRAHWCHVTSHHVTSRRAAPFRVALILSAANVIARFRRASLRSAQQRRCPAAVVLGGVLVIQADCSFSSRSRRCHRHPCYCPCRPPFSRRRWSCDFTYFVSEYASALRIQTYVPRG